jgi:hypothetical protein
MVLEGLPSLGVQADRIADLTGELAGGPGASA